jgi:hypothetical protein
MHYRTSDQERIALGFGGHECNNGAHTGYTADVIAHRGVLEKGVSFINKPFSLTTLAEKVRDVLDGAPPADEP